MFSNVSSALGRAGCNNFFRHRNLKLDAAPGQDRHRRAIRNITIGTAISYS